MKVQSGRSMIEMLGVLAIVGVLSVGALSGYSMAMHKFKVNKAVNEISDTIEGIKTLYAEKNNYDGMTAELLRNAGIMPDNNSGGNSLNAFDLQMYAADTTRRPTGFDFIYYLSDDNACRDLLVSLKLDTMQNNLDSIYVVNQSDVTSSFRWHLTNDFSLPIKLAGAIEGCKDIQYILFIIK